jgi:serine/threonine protein kinase
MQFRSVACGSTPILHSVNDMNPDGHFQVAWEDGERVFHRGWRLGDDGSCRAVLIVLPAAERPSPANLERLAHEYELKNELDGTWAVQPLELVRDGGRAMLVLKDPGGEPLELLLGAPLEVGHFLRLASGIAMALGKVHQRGLVHKDIKLANILVNGATGEVRFTGFGIASRLSRERHWRENRAERRASLPHPLGRRVNQRRRPHAFRADRRCSRCRRRESRCPLQPPWHPCRGRRSAIVARSRYSRRSFCPGGLCPRPLTFNLRVIAGSTLSAVLSRCAGTVFSRMPCQIAPRFFCFESRSRNPGLVSKFVERRKTYPRTTVRLKRPAEPDAPCGVSR